MLTLAVSMLVQSPAGKPFPKDRHAITLRAATAPGDARLSGR
jgi:hypothetical protein